MPLCVCISLVLTLFKSVFIFGLKLEVGVVYSRSLFLMNRNTMPLERLENTNTKQQFAELYSHPETDVWWNFLESFNVM